jgi:hypothetical protein
MLFNLLLATEMPLRGSEAVNEITEMMEQSDGTGD